MVLKFRSFCLPWVLGLQACTTVPNLSWDRVSLYSQTRLVSNSQRSGYLYFPSSGIKVYAIILAPFTLNVWSDSYITLNSTFFSFFMVLGIELAHTRHVLALRYIHNPEVIKELIYCACNLFSADVGTAWGGVSSPSPLQGRVALTVLGWLAQRPLGDSLLLPCCSDTGTTDARYHT